MRHNIGSSSRPNLFDSTHRDREREHGPELWDYGPRRARRATEILTVWGLGPRIIPSRILSAGEAGVRHRARAREPSRLVLAERARPRSTRPRARSGQQLKELAQQEGQHLPARDATTADPDVATASST